MDYLHFKIRVIFIHHINTSYEVILMYILKLIKLQFEYVLGVTSTSVFNSTRMPLLLIAFILNSFACCLCPVLSCLFEFKKTMNRMVKSLAHHKLNPSFDLFVMVKSGYVISSVCSVFLMFCMISC